MSDLQLPLAPMAKVECGTCRACCKGQIIPLLPGIDDPAKYDSRPITKNWRALSHKPDGSCVYLGEAGCSIWPNHPAVCKAYDCVDDFKKRTRNERRQRLKAGLASAEVYAEGRRRAEGR